MREKHNISIQGHFTLFVPTDEAFAHEKKYPSEVGVADKLQFHVGLGRYMAKDIEDEATIKTLLHHRTIRFNIYPNKKTTANGREIVSADHVATNGVIHVINRVMSSVYARLIQF
jgi:uncharacterized surface protein with fasciclin (FAS1) repeats